MRTTIVKNALITGGASGMGRGIAQALGKLGIQVFVADIDHDGAAETARLVNEDGGGSQAFKVDVSQSHSVNALFQELKNRARGLDLLVHTAAVLGRTAFMEEVGDDEWQRMMAVNLDGTFYCCRETVRWMKESGGGRILLFSSVASLTPTPGAIAYSASKGAVNMMARTLAMEAAKHNIRVNVIAPGYINTPMLAELPEGFEEYITKKTPLKRLGDVDEIAGLVAFMAGADADFFTGQVLSPNGGLVI